MCELKIIADNGVGCGSSGWHEPRGLQPPVVHILLSLGHCVAVRGQRPCTAQVFPPSGVLGDPARGGGGRAAPLCRSLHCCYRVEESQTKESGLISRVRVTAVGGKKKPAPSKATASILSSPPELLPHLDVLAEGK